jgi:rhodanese-related sulfurtransferase
MAKVKNQKSKTKDPRPKTKSAIGNRQSAMFMSYKLITPTELNHRLKRGEKLFLIDVREPVEFEIARIEGAELFPITRMNEWVGLIRSDEEIVVICHHGIRSAQVCSFLAQQGFDKVYNLTGGMDAWAEEVNTKMPRY